MATLSGIQLTQLAIQAGFPPSAAPTAAAIALAESSGRSEAVSATDDYGLMQINRRFHPQLFQQYAWQVPAQNMRMGFEVWQDAGQSFRPWVTYNNNRYRMYLSQVGTVNQNGQITRPNPIPGGPDIITDPVGADEWPTVEVGQATIVDFIESASNPVFWLRVGMFVGGVMLVGVGLYGLMANSKIGRTAISVASRGVVSGGQ